MRRALAALILTTCLLGAWVWPALAKTGQSARQTLKGIKGVMVIVTGISPEAEREGLKKADLQADVESRLKQAGIKVLSRTERFQAPGQPHLYVRCIDQKRTDMELYAISIAVHLEQHVRLTRDAKVLVPAETWGMTGVVSVGARELQSVRRLVVDYVDMFVEAMNVANGTAWPALLAPAVLVPSAPQTGQKTGGNSSAEPTAETAWQPAPLPAAQN
ncbi:DUF4410 domain-containing protein [Desulfarculales bacterium]